MKITPKTEQEIQESRLLKDGKYPFEISGAEDQISKSSGLPMIVLTVRVYDEEDKIHLLTDYLSSSEKAAFKVRNVCKATGLIENYDAGNLEPDMFIGKTGYLEIITEDNIKYGKQNKIKEYVVNDAEKPVRAAKKDGGKVADILEDEIPF